MDGAYIINLDEYADVGTHWKLFSLIVLLLNMFLKKFIGHKNTKQTIQ